jgi:hypothetical protein
MVLLLTVRGEILFANAKFGRFAIRAPTVLAADTAMPQKKASAKWLRPKLVAPLHTLALAKRREECVSTRRVTAWLS